jgi:hypothetical protein
MDMRTGNCALNFFVRLMNRKVEGSPVHPPSLSSKQRRGRLIYTAMSLLLVWHSVAIVVAATPESVITETVTSLFQPYLSLFRLQNEWSFYAPDVRVEPEFRYVVEDASGQQHTFVPADKLSRYLPIDIWVKDWYIHVMDNPETYSKFVAIYLCREHASLRPVSITLLEFDQRDFLPQDQLSGKHPFDPEFLDEKTLATVQCPNA